MLKLPWILIWAMMGIAASALIGDLYLNPHSLFTMVILLIIILLFTAIGYVTHDLIIIYEAKRRGIEID